MRGAGALMAALLALLPVGADAATVDPAVLRSALSDPLDSSYVEANIGDADTLEGPFDAVVYATTVYSNTDDQNSVRDRLKYDGLIGGWGRSFYRESNKGWLVEAIFAFGSASDARSFWGYIGQGLRESTTTTRVLDTSAIPSSAGAEYLYDSFHGTEIAFARGNDVFDLYMGTDTEYLTEDAMAQARQQYSHSPANTVPPSAQREAHPGPIFMRNIAYGLGVLVAIVLGLSVIAGAIVVIFMVRRSRRGSAPASLLSPDGRYWWDGQAWRPTTTP